MYRLSVRLPFYKLDLPGWGIASWIAMLGVL